MRTPDTHCHPRAVLPHCGKSEWGHPTPRVRAVKARPGFESPLDHQIKHLSFGWGVLFYVTAMRTPDTHCHPRAVLPHRGKSEWGHPTPRVRAVKARPGFESPLDQA